MVKINDNSIRLASSTATPNDLLPFLAVLAEINAVVSQTYGPDAGYVAQHTIHDKQSLFTYTKDGLTTLDYMLFGDNLDNFILAQIKQLANRIKATSGDGSTTATKLLYYIVKNAVSKTYNMDNSKLNTFRINTPKAMEIIIKLFNKIIDDYTLKENDYEDLKAAALIALNNDKSLMPPINQVIDHMKSKNAPINESLQINAFRSFTDETYVDVEPGYMLGVNSFSINNQIVEMQNVKVVMIPNGFTLDFLHFIFSAILQAAQEQSNGMRVVFLINYMDENTRIWVNKMLKKAQSENTELRVELIELQNAAMLSEGRILDLSYLLNTDPISLQAYVEKRDTIIDGSEIDTPNTTNLVKWRAVAINGQMDYTWGWTKFKEEYIKNLEKSFYCNIKHTPGLGLTLSLSSVATSEQITEEYKKVLDDHINTVKAAANSKDPDIARDALGRLQYLLDNFYVIHVAKRIGDDARIYTAYKDAVKAITSIAKYGSYMGGSVGLHTVMEDVYNSYIKEYSKDEANKDIRDTVVFLLELIIESIEQVICDLKIKFNGLSFNEVYDKYIDVDNDTIDGTKVIIPVETDKVMIPNTLYLFSNIFASLYIELSSPLDAVRFKMLSMDVRKAIEKDLNPDPTKPSTPTKTDEVIEEVVEDTELDDDVYDIPEEIIDENLEVEDNFEDNYIDEELTNPTILYEDEDEIMSAPSLMEDIFSDEDYDGGYVDDIADEPVEVIVNPKPTISPKIEHIESPTNNDVLSLEDRLAALIKEREDTKREELAKSNPIYDPNADPTIINTIRNASASMMLDPKDGWVRDTDIAASNPIPTRKEIELD